MATRRRGTVRLLGSLAAAMAFLLIFPVSSRFVDDYDLRAYDSLLSQIHRQRTVDPRLVIVGVDNQSIKVLGAWPWSRERYAALLNVLRRAHAASAALDFTFTERHAAAPDQAFAAALHRFGRAVLAFKYKGGRPETPDPLFTRAAAAIGYIDVDTRDFQIDPILRRARLAARLGDGRWCFSLDLTAVALADGVPLDRIQVAPDGIRVGTLFIPTNERHEILIPYYQKTALARGESGFVEDLLTPVSYLAALSDPPRDFKDAVVLVGASDPDVLGDVHPTPFGEVPGIFIHGQIVNALLTRCWLREVPAGWSVLLAVLLPVALGIPMMRMRWWTGALLAAGAMAALWGATAALFAAGWWLRAVAPTVAIGATALALEAWHYRRSHELLGRFVAPEVADALVGAGGRPASEEREVTILFSDIRGYTTISEKATPAQVARLVNEYHQRTVKIYEKHGGRCVDYLGDAQMVIYGAPARLADHAAAALRAACEVQEELRALAREWRERGLPELEVGIGVCTGLAAVGLVGSDENLKYSALGDATNTAARLQAMSRELQSPVLASEATIRHAGEAVEAEPLTEVKLKGKDQAVMVYRVRRVKAREAR